MLQECNLFLIEIQMYYNKGRIKDAFFGTIVLNYHGINKIKQTAFSKSLLFCLAEQIFIYSIKVRVYPLDE